MRDSALTIDQLPDRRCILRREGGSVYTAQNNGKYYVIQDESTLAFLLDEDDLAGTPLVKILEFDTAGERSAYLTQRFGPRD